MSIHPEENNALMNLRDTGLGGMSALGQKQTSELSRVMSALCQKRTYAAQQILAYSITLSARVSKVAGTSMPSDLAVCRLMTNSNLVDCATGKSAGLAPLRTLPA